MINCLAYLYLSHSFHKDHAVPGDKVIWVPFVILVIFWYFVILQLSWSDIITICSFLLSSNNSDDNRQFINFTFRRFWQVGQSGGQREQNLWFMETWFMQIVHHWYSENMPKVIMIIMVVYSKQGHAAYLWWRTRIKALLHSHIPAMPAKTTLL